MENNKAFTLTNRDRASFFLLSPAFLANGSRVQKEHKELFYFDRVEKDVAPPCIFSEELYTFSR